MTCLKSLSALLLASFLPLASAAPAANAKPDLIPGKYIVQLKPTVNTTQAEHHISWVRGIHSSSMGKRQLDNLPGLERKIVIGNFIAYSGGFDDATIKLIKANTDVLLVEQDRYFYPIDTFEAFPEDLVWPGQSSAIKGRSLAKRGLVHQPNPTWALKVISQRPRPQYNSYIFDSTAGQNTWAYVVDTGINTAHRDFGGRASAGWTGFPSQPNADRDGHGTHCAGIIGSNTYGVAKLSKLISVKVFDPSTPSSGSLIMDGYAWAVNDIRNNGRVGKAVISMSLGGGRSQTTNNAIKAAYDAGITTVVAAGNSNADAYDTSPASAPEAITVGASDINYQRASYSNYGSVVDLFAPGTDILSTWHTSDTATSTASGTSMACPHVAGLAIYFMSIYGVMPPGQLAYNMVRVSNKNALGGIPSGTANNLAYNDDGV